MPKIIVIIIIRKIHIIMKQFRVIIYRGWPAVRATTIIIIIIVVYKLGSKQLSTAVSRGCACVLLQNI